MKKRVFALMLLSVSLLFAGCLTDSGDDDGKDGGTAQGASAYMPFKTGATWTFAETETSYMVTPPDVSTSTSTTVISGQLALNNQTYWVATEDTENDTYIRIASNGNDVYEYGLDSYISKTITDFPVAAKRASLEGEVLVYKFGQKAGTTWDIGNFSESFEGSTIAVTITGKFVGLETVTVPAGTYNSCAHMDMTINTTTTYLGLTIPTSSTIVSAWFAPNVGPVKTQDVTTFAGEKGYEYVGKLTSYSIP